MKNQEGICPLCGCAIKLNYDAIESTDSGAMCPWSCPSCNAKGEAHYDLSFVMHLGVFDKDLNEYDYDGMIDSYYKI